MKRAIYNFTFVFDCRAWWGGGVGFKSILLKFGEVVTEGIKI
jgi:hypothetical protein